MTQYCHIEDDIIDEEPRSLPGSFRDAKGTRRLKRATKAELKGFGWLPVRRAGFDDFDPSSQIRTGPVGSNIGDTVPPDADEVVSTYTVRNKTAQELDDEHEARRVAADIFYASPEMSALIDSIEDNVPAARGKIRAAARNSIP